MKHRDEQLSAFTDNALDEKELKNFMQDLKRSPVADAEQLQRYQIMRDVMKDELDQTSFMDISASVHRMLEQEDELYTEPVKAKSASIINLSAWMRPLSGLAIAASVAMFTVVSVRMVSTDSNETTQPVVAETQVTTPIKQVIPVNQDLLQQIRVVSTAEPEQANRLREQQLREYMMNHSEYAGQSTIQGMMPYARVVSFDPQAKQ